MSRWLPKSAWGKALVLALIHTVGWFYMLQVVKLAIGFAIFLVYDYDGTLSPFRWLFAPRGEEWISYLLHLLVVSPIIYAVLAKMLIFGLLDGGTVRSLGRIRSCWIIVIFTVIFTVFQWLSIFIQGGIFSLARDKTIQSLASLLIFGSFSEKDIAEYMAAAVIWEVTCSLVGAFLTLGAFLTIAMFSKSLKAQKSAGHSPIGSAVFILLLTLGQPVCAYDVEAHKQFLTREAAILLHFSQGHKTDAYKLLGHTLHLATE